MHVFNLTELAFLRKLHPAMARALQVFCIQPPYFIL